MQDEFARSKQFLFVVSKKYMGKSWANWRAHGNSIGLFVHCIVEAKFELSHIGENINKRCLRNRKQNSFTVVQSISADLKDIFQWNIRQQTRDIKGTEKEAS